MVEADRKLFGELLGKYGALYGKPMDNKQQAAWYEQLRKYDLVVIDAAMEKAAEEHLHAGWFELIETGPRRTAVRYVCEG